MKTSLWKDQTNFRDLLYVCMSGLLSPSLNISRHDLRTDNFDSIYKKYV